jgi:hypothetical protein
VWAGWGTKVAPPLAVRVPLAEMGLSSLTTPVPGAPMVSLVPRMVTTTVLSVPSTLRTVKDSVRESPLARLWTMGLPLSRVKVQLPDSLMEKLP